MEIHVLAWDQSDNAAGLNQLMGLQPFFSWLLDLQ